jgi:hypothetical protein
MVVMVVAVVAHLLVVAAVHGEALGPEVGEEGRQHVVLDVLRRHALRGHALLHHLEHDLLNLLVRRRELADQDHHHLRVRMANVRAREHSHDPIRPSPTLGQL